MTPALYALLGVLLAAVIGPLIVFTIAALAGDVAEGTVYSEEQWKERRR